MDLRVIGSGKSFNLYAYTSTMRLGAQLSLDCRIEELHPVQRDMFRESALGHLQKFPMPSIVAELRPLSNAKRTLVLDFQSQSD